MIRELFIAIGIVLWANINYTADAQVKLTLTGQTTNVSIKQEPSSVVATVTLDLTLKNVAGADVILYWHDFEIVADSVIQYDENQRAKVLSRTSTYPSANRSPAWTSLQRQLDLTTPPSHLTRTLRNGESITLKRTRELRFYRKGLYQASWTEILRSSPVWLTVTLDMFPANLDKTSIDQESFGKRLQEKWKSKGVLQLGALESEPIRLDLGNPGK